MERFEQNVGGGCEKNKDVFCIEDCLIIKCTSLI